MVRRSGSEKRNRNRRRHALESGLIEGLHDPASVGILRREPYTVLLRRIEKMSLCLVRFGNIYAWAAVLACNLHEYQFVLWNRTAHWGKPEIRARTSTRCTFYIYVHRQNPREIKDILNNVIFHQKQTSETCKHLKSGDNGIFEIKILIEAYRLHVNTSK